MFEAIKERTSTESSTLTGFPSLSGLSLSEAIKEVNISRIFIPDRVSSPCQGYLLSER
jgi:hypothetical protein